MHVQFMVTNRDTLIDAQKHPEEYQDLMGPCVRFQLLLPYPEQGLPR